MGKLIIIDKSAITLNRSSSSSTKLDPALLLGAVKEFDRVMETFAELEVPIGDILGLRNLSAFIGEVFNYSVVKISNGSVRKNPHQDGYPDLLIMDKFGSQEWDKVKHQTREKTPFSPFSGGGIEVKATCGDLRSAKWFREHGGVKPDIGDTRLDHVIGYNWKAHHRETNNLCGLIWDFIDGTPTIVAIMYSSDLTENDWGNMVTPVAGGGRTTSVSIMGKSGVSKMISGLIAVVDDPTYTEKLLTLLKSKG